MSIVDGIIGGGLAANKVRGETERVLFYTGRTGRVWGSGGLVVVATKTLPAGDIGPGCLLKFRGLFSKYATASSGWSMRIKFVQGANTVTVASLGMSATHMTVPFEFDMFMSGDRKWAFSTSYNINIFGAASTVVGVNSPNFIVANVSPSLPSPRGKTAAAEFVSYSAPPTVETILIDFDQPVTVNVELNNTTSDSAELLGFSMTSQSLARDVSTPANSKSTICPGDSLTEGTGSTTANDWVSSLGKLRPGRPVLNEGLGGQKITEIVDRVVADPVCGKYWDMVFWGYINDVVTDGPAWWAVVQAQIARLMAFRASTARTPIFLNVHESTAWTADQKAAATYVNAQLLAAYPNNTVDVATAINGTAGYYSDTVHLNDSGYAVVAGLIDAKMTALGWA